MAAIFSQGMKQGMRQPRVSYVRNTCAKHIIPNSLLRGCETCLLGVVRNTSLLRGAKRLTQATD